MEGRVLDVVLGVVFGVVGLREKTASAYMQHRTSDRRAHLEGHAVVAHGLVAMTTELGVLWSRDHAIALGPEDVDCVLLNAFPWSSSGGGSAVGGRSR